MYEPVRRLLEEWGYKALKTEGYSTDQRYITNFKVRLDDKNYFPDVVGFNRNLSAVSVECKRGDAIWGVPQAVASLPFFHTVYVAAPRCSRVSKTFLEKSGIGYIRFEERNMKPLKGEVPNPTKNELFDEALFSEQIKSKAIVSLNLRLLEDKLENVIETEIKGSRPKFYRGRGSVLKGSALQIFTQSHPFNKDFHFEIRSELRDGETWVGLHLEGDKRENKRVYTSLQPLLSKLDSRLKEELNLKCEKKHRPKWIWLETPIEKVRLLDLTNEDAEKVTLGLSYYINALSKKLDSLIA